MYDLVIIGSGPAGMGAALYALRAGKSMLLIEKEYEGAGQIEKSHLVDNYLGIPQIDGYELGSRFREHIKNYDIEILEDEVKEIIRDNVWILRTAEGREITASAIIYATGATPRKLGIPGENEYAMRGVSYCAYCDGSIYRNKTVAVVGGGDSALDDALYLSSICEKVYLIHRREEFRGNEKSLAQIHEIENVEILTNRKIEKISGDKKLNSIYLNSGEKLEVQGLFIAIGSIPNTELLKDYAKRDQQNYIISSEEGITDSPGLFVAGDLRRKSLRQVITAVSDGANAASSAIKWLNQKG